MCSKKLKNKKKLHFWLVQPITIPKQDMEPHQEMTTETLSEKTSWYIWRELSLNIDKNRYC